MPAPTVVYTGTEACPKCGNADPARHSVGFVASGVIEGKDYDYLELVCQRCGYVEDKLPMDAE